MGSIQALDLVDVLTHLSKRGSISTDRISAAIHPDAPIYTEEQIAAVKGIRPRNGKYECVVTHPSLPRHGMSRLFDDERSASIWKLTQLERLNALARGQSRSEIKSHGLTPQEVARHAKRPSAVYRILSEFITTAPNLSRTMKLQAGYLRGEKVLDIRYEHITPMWINRWVAGYKTGANRITPQSIRKKVDCLRLTLDWYHQHYWAQAGLALPVNHLDKLPRKYQNYAEDDANAVVNRRRKRRLQLGEEASIEDVVLGRKKRRCNRPVNNPAETMMLWRLIANTGLRLREAYTLRAKDVDLTRALIHVSRSKLSYKGEAAGARTVPFMNTELYRWVTFYCDQQGIEPGSDKPLFACFWQGQRDPDELDKISNGLSQMFASLHKDAGCENLREHDLRHEATSRWCEVKGADGKPRYDKRDVMTFTGHTSESTFAGYLHYFMDAHVPEDVQALIPA